MKKMEPIIYFFLKKMAPIFNIKNKIHIFYGNLNKNILI